MRLSSLLFSLLFSFSGFAQTDQACTTAYNKMYGDGVLTMSVFYGYTDSDDYVDDQINKANMITRLTWSCNPTLTTQLCGFARDPDDADILTKTIIRANGKQDKVRLRLMSSSVSDSHKKNMGALKKSQDAQSKLIEDAYFRSLQTDDVVIYNGHARRGTGPGFRPMGNSDWIKATTMHPNLSRMTSALKTAKHKPAIIGMITCEGESHYGKALQEAAPDSGLLLTRQTTSFLDAGSLLESSLDNVLRKTCAMQFRKEIQATTTDIFNSPMDGTDNYRDKLPEIYNFFEVNKKKFPPQRGVLMTLVNSNYEETSSVDQEQKKGQKPAPSKRPVKTSQ